MYQILYLSKYTDINTANGNYINLLGPSQYKDVVLPV